MAAAQQLIESHCARFHARVPLSWRLLGHSQGGDAAALLAYVLGSVPTAPSVLVFAQQFYRHARNALKP